MSGIAFDDLNEKDRTGIIDSIVKIITTPDVIIKTPCRDGMDYLWLTNPKDETSFGIVKSLNENYYCRHKKFIFYAPQYYIGGTYKFYVLTKLPERVLGLLAIIHRPMYEYYKKAMSEEK